MKTTDFNKTITSARLKENLEKQFGSKVNLNKYNREQLEDFRNKIRTRIFQQEGTAGINDLLTNETYQKDKAMLELLNTRIFEMLGEQMQQLRDRMDQLSEAKKGTRPPKTKITAKGTKPDFLDMDKDGDKKEPMKKAVADKKKNPFAKVKEGAKPDYIDLDKDGDKKEPMKKAAKDKAAKEDIQQEGWDDMMKAVKDKAGTQPNGGAGVKKGSRYGGSKQTDKPEHDEPTATKSKKVKEGMKHAKDCDCKECMSTFEGKDEGKPGKNFAKIAKSAGGGEKGNKIAGAVRAKLAKQGKLEESQFKHNVRFVNESIQYLLNEDEEAKAKTITAAGDMVNDFTSWMQRVGQYQTKAIIELSDAIRADFGQAEAETFKQTVGPALSATLETLTSQREAISNAVAVLAGEAAPAEPMGMDPELGTEPGMDASEPDIMNPAPDAGDEFGASDAAAGGAETAGRGMRESREARRARKLAESHSIISKLAR
jgi:hypothetical protein